jgi:hypothetical protein
MTTKGEKAPSAQSRDELATIRNIGKRVEHQATGRIGTVIRSARVPFGAKHLIAFEGHQEWCDSAELLALSTKKKVRCVCRERDCMVAHDECECGCPRADWQEGDIEPKPAADE